MLAEIWEDAASSLAVKYQVYGMEEHAGTKGVQNIGTRVDVRRLPHPCSGLGGRPRKIYYEVDRRGV